MGLGFRVIWGYPWDYIGFCDNIIENQLEKNMQHYMETAITPSSGSVASGGFP